jgi:starch synthase
MVCFKQGMNTRKMDILHVAMELCPVAKVGGLGDVVLGLSLELKRQKHRPKILIPKYNQLKVSQIKNLKLYKKVKCLFKNKAYQNSIYSGKVLGLDVYFIEDHTPRKFFSRDHIYNYKDDALRFNYFCQVALNFIQSENKPLDVLHLHDWHTCLLAHTFKKYFPNTKTVLTVHNFAYQGLCTQNDFDSVGILDIPKAFYDQQFKNKFNLLKGGLLLCDQITTVSPNFAKEALHKVVNGRGLEKTIRKIKDKYRGILNGIDYSVWDTTKDPFIAKKIKPINKTTFKGWSECKIKNKIDLQKYVNLNKNPSKPIVACVTRLVPQKGPSLIQHAIQYTLKKGGQFILLGSQPNKALLSTFQTLKQQTKSSRDCYIQFEHNERLAHKIFAGADFFIIPSLFEPCGITQMIALHFGTLPIVRKTGGLADTVIDYKSTSRKKNGFVFVPFTKHAIRQAIDHAFNVYNQRPDLRKKLILNALHQKYDWKGSCKEYLKVYKK